MTFWIEILAMVERVVLRGAPEDLCDLNRGVNFDSAKSGSGRVHNEMVFCW